MKLICNKSSPPLGGMIIARYASTIQSVPIEIIWGSETSVETCSQKIPCITSNDVARVIAHRLAESQLYGSNPLEKTEVDHWLSYAIGSLNYDFADAILHLNKVLSSLTYLVGKRLTIADLIIFSILYVNKQWQDLISNKQAPTNVLRWYSFIDSQECVRTTLNSLPSDVKTKLTTQPTKQSREHETISTPRAQEGKFVDLPGAEMGKVVVRFPPEASGYLHIGHAKAALLNQYYQQAFQGKLIMRFDDTNPAKENVHFEKVILEDVEMLEIKPDLFTHTSQYFDVMLEYCEKLLKEGKAYVDDTDPELMKQQREQRIESVNRNNAYEKNFQLWKEMKQGTEKGQKCCVRAKIDMQSPNGCMRDPTIYRCKNEQHPRTGNTYKVYPTYDFACPIVDAIENVTHVLRTMEYHDRDVQFYWFIDALGLRKPYIWEYSRLSMTNTVLSKRKLTWFVENRLVDGWDDPRFPTVRGVLRRGMTVEGLKQFIIAQGSSRSVVFMEWDKIWAFNKKVIDPVAPRYTAIEHASSIPVLVKGVKEEKLVVPAHPKNSDVGLKDVWVGPRILIDLADAKCLKEGENTTFINWGNLMITKINKENDKIVSVEAKPNLENKDYKKTLKLTWLADIDSARFTPTWCVYFDHIISKSLLGKDEDFKNFVGHETQWSVQMLGDPELKKLKKGDIIQLQRRGYFRVDVAYGPLSLYTCKERAIILFAIPDGHTKENPIAGVPKAAISSKSISVKAVESPVKSASKLNDEIISQGDEVRNLKNKKAAKGEIDSAVKKLLELKAEYKSLTNIDWKPGCVPPVDDTTQNSTVKVNTCQLSAKVAFQGDKVRQLKSEKAAKDVLESEVKILLALKAEYKQLTGNDWKPETIPNLVETNEKVLLDKINAHGNRIRDLKSKKADKTVIDKEVKVLLDLKSNFKDLTGKDWKPDMQRDTPTEAKSQNGDCGDASKELLTSQINEQGELVRKLKADAASKDKLDPAIKKLLELKSKYKTLTGTDFPTIGKNVGKTNAKEKPTKPKAVSKEIKSAESEDASGVKKQTRLGLEAKKEENLSDWYSQVITKGELIEYYDVSGCYILRPWSYTIWEAIKDWFDKEIKKLGVENCYFPLFVSKSALEKEKTHIADFSPEVAWVTKSGDTELAEPIAVRPTSETIMYPAYAKWVQSYRDLPIKLNQWNNVVRWEFKHPQPFLRTREFLWQEGHTAYANKEEACEEVGVMLDLYAKIYTDILAIPVIKGRKTEKEKFAGGDFTYTIEAFVSATGRGIQAATSHHLGQNFSKMFEIVFDDPETREKQFAYQNSWGITTRTIGVMVMVHADNQGLVLPPRVASIQIIIVPCGVTVNLTEVERAELQQNCDHLVQELTNVGLRCKGDYRDNYSPGWKFNHWELKGVPIRVELGPKDIKNKQIVAVRRDTGQKITLRREHVVKELSLLLENIQESLFKKASEDFSNHTVQVTDWQQFTPNLDRKNVILAPFCGEIDCEDRIKADSSKDSSEVAESGAPAMGAKALCIPFEQPTMKPNAKCIHFSCKNNPKFYTLFGRSY